MNTVTPTTETTIISQSLRHSENLGNLAAAVIQVMQKVSGVEKNLRVSTGGNNSYQGVSDKDVKEATRADMAEAGLCLLPVSINGKATVTRWEESGQYGTSQKQSVFTEVNPVYKLIHSPSGEWIEVEGYGHGVDSQDKSAGKALTYSLKYLLLYMFLIPTGKIDDADTEHSNNIAAPKSNVIYQKPQQIQSNGTPPPQATANSSNNGKPQPTEWLNEPRITEYKDKLKAGKSPDEKQAILQEVYAKYKVSTKVRTELIELAK